MKLILLGFVTMLFSFSQIECFAQTSKLPKTMPENAEISFNSNGGMLYAFTKIEIKNRIISVEEKNGNEKEPRFWAAKIEQSEVENLYKIFVENKFDTIKNDERKGIVYDAGSEGVSIKLGDSAFFSKTYGANSPMSGDSKRRYQNIANAIHALRSRYENKNKDKPRGRG